ncbi:hypothetical protein [Halomonas sp. E19]
MIAAFAVLMASVSLFTYVQIARNAHQTHQRRLSRAHDALTPTLSLTRRVARHTNPATAGFVCLDTANTPRCREIS